MVHLPNKPSDRNFHDAEASFSKPVNSFSPNKQSEVFDNLLMRLDKLKETLELEKSGIDPLITSKTSSPKHTMRDDSGRSLHVFEMEEDIHRFSNDKHFDQKPMNEKSKQGQSGQYFHELSPIGQYIVDASMEDQSKNEILSIIDPRKSNALDFNDKKFGSPKSKQPKKEEAANGDLEYSASKKESYMSQIDNFLTNETNMSKPQSYRSKVETKPEDNHAKKSLEKTPKFSGHNQERKKLIAIEANPSVEKSYFELKPLNILDKTKKISSKSPKQTLQNINQQQGGPSPYFARLMRDYGIRHQEEEKNFQRREEKFRNIKSFLDKEERRRSRDRSSKKERSDSKVSKSRKSSRHRREAEKHYFQDLQERLSHLDEKINQYEFTFKNSDLLDDTYKPVDRQDASVNQMKNSSKSKNKKSQLQEHKEETDNWKSDTKNQKSVQKGYIFENWTEDDRHETYQSNDDYESAKSVKPPISFEIPVDNSKAQQEITERSTLKDAYSKFVAQKSQKNLHRPTASQHEKENYYHSPTTHVFLDQKGNPRKSSISPAPQLSKSPRNTKDFRFEDVKSRRSEVRTEVEILNAKTKLLRAEAKKRNERIKTYDATRRNIR